MQLIIYRYRIVIIASFLFFLYSYGLCQEDQKEKITWDDIEGITSHPGNGTQISTVPYSPQPIFSQKDEMTVVPESAIPEVRVKEDEAQAIKATPEVKKESPQVSAQQAPVVKAGTKTEAAAAQKVTSTKKRRSQEESVWQRTNTITREEPTSNREIFVTNPYKE